MLIKSSQQLKQSKSIIVAFFRLLQGEGKNASKTNIFVQFEFMQRLSYLTKLNRGLYPVGIAQKGGGGGGIEGAPSAFPRVLLILPVPSPSPFLRLLRSYSTIRQIHSKPDQHGIHRSLERTYIKLTLCKRKQ